MATLVRRLLIGTVGILTAVVAVTLPATAQSGCTATIDGIDVTTAHSPKSAIRVDADATIAVAGQAPGPITGYQVDMVFGPFSFTAADGTVTGGDTGYSTTVDVGDYARFGVGLYRVEGRTTGTVCDEWTYVEVVGRSPLSTLAGAIGAGAAIAGLTGMATAATGAAKAGRAAAGASTTSTASGTGGPS
ncbi:MAG TPA: hypothetical protein VK866_15985 [Acidimicrobiales bacterium]|nr:hypothetical protein [Acidimicrobiales bacterium]